MNTFESKISTDVKESDHAEATAKNPSAKDRVMEDGKLTVLEFLYIARYFLPVLTTIGWIIGFTLGNMAFFEYLALILIGIGLLAAITVSPLRFLKFIFTSAINGFRLLRGFIPFYGVADLIAAVFGISFGFVFGLVVVFCVPAIFTIAKFFNEDSFE